jgi:pullulanase
MEEYHIDGFRFDLMGLIDLDTMKEIEKTVYQINKKAVLYGEGWNAGESMYEGDTLESVQAWQTPKIGTFNNVFRRAVQKFICSFVEERDTLIGMRYGFVGAGKNENTMADSGSWTENPLQCINYASCHDGYTLWDLITLSCPDESLEKRMQRDCFGAASVLLCQGTPFIHSGEEFLRTKTSQSNPDVKYGNSYNAGDYVNQIDWEKRTEYKDVAEYYKGLIAFRKEHIGLRYQTQKELNENLVFMEGLPENVMGYYLTEPYLFFVDKQICLVFNPTEDSVELAPAIANWKVYVNAEKAGTERIETIKKGERFSVEGISAFAAVGIKVHMDRILAVASGLVILGVIAVIRKKKKG